MWAPDAFVKNEDNHLCRGLIASQETLVALFKGRHQAGNEGMTRLEEMRQKSFHHPPAGVVDWHEMEQNRWCEAMNSLCTAVRLHCVY